MSPATPADGMFPETAVDPFVLAPEVEDLAMIVLRSFDEFRAIADEIAAGTLTVAFVFENRDFDPTREPLKHDAIAKVRTVPAFWGTWVQTDLVIQFRRWFWDRFDDAARRRTLHHEWSHVEILDGRLSLRHHEVEDFAATLRAFGPRPWHREFFKAYLDWSHGQEHPEPTPLRPVEAIVADVERMPVGDQLTVHAAVKGARGLRDLAERTGTRVEVTFQGRTVGYGPRETFGGLVEPGEALEEAYARLERRPDFIEVSGTEAGQQLLEELNRRADIARRSGRRVDTETGEILDGGES